MPLEVDEAVQDPTLVALRSAVPKPGFEAMGEGCYAYHVPEHGISLFADRVRREQHQLIVELAVRCLSPGARTTDGAMLSIADCNLSSARARQERAKLLAERAKVKGVDWPLLIETFALRVIEAERTGQPAVDLRSLPKPGPEDSLRVDGLRLPRRHPCIIFGDGGAAKSYLALYVAGRLAESGLSVAYFDWELASEDHRDRLERLFPDGMPRIVYARCDRPLVHERERLHRIVRTAGVDYAVYDSIAFACDGPPEAAEVAAAYFRAVRQIGVGSLHLAHTNRSDRADEKPFGSTFWHNGSRCTWFAKLAPEGSRENSITLGLFCKKFNLGRLPSPTGWEIVFDGETTRFTRTDVAETPELAVHLTTKQRLIALLRRGAMTIDELAAELGLKPDTVGRTLRRHRQVFVSLGGGRYGLLSTT